MVPISLQELILVPRQSETSKAHFVASIGLYRYPQLPVSQGNLLRRHRHWYNLPSIGLLLAQKSTHSSCDVTD